MKIPILDLKRQYQSIKSEIDSAIARVIESGQFILGPEVEAFEREVAQYLGVKHAIGVASGTDALWLALKAAGIGPGDRVIVPSFTFFATAGAVCNVGAIPVFADIDPRTFNLDPSSVQNLLESDTQLQDQAKAIIPVHLYGQPAEMDTLLKIARHYELIVIEDVAQAIGAQYKDRTVGTLGHLGCFSFFPTKNLGAYGDGGLVVTNDGALAERVRMLRVHGSKPKYYHHIVGTNSRLDALQAAILRVKLTHLDEWTSARQKLAARYDQALSQIEGLAVPYKAPDRTHIYHQYTIRVLGGRRDALQKHLKEHGIGTEIYYPLPLHLQPCFQHLGYREGQLPESERASREVLSLPMFPELTEKEQGYIIAAVRDFMANQRSL
jgi:dTDP-4-amino-4,6-dideoxygalactose transaminase